MSEGVEEARRGKVVKRIYEEVKETGEGSRDQRGRRTGKEDKNIKKRE